jgi:hypothetical protein
VPIISPRRRTQPSLMIFIDNYLHFVAALTNRVQPVVRMLLLNQVKMPPHTHVLRPRDPSYAFDYFRVDSLQGTLLKMSNHRSPRLAARSRRSLHTAILITENLSLRPLLFSMIRSLLKFCILRIAGSRGMLRASSVVLHNENSRLETTV